MKTKDENHLINLVLDWRRDPIKYNKEMAITIEKIINNVMGSNSSMVNALKLMESVEDIKADMRLVCVKAILNLAPPYTNKRIFNYLKISIKFALRDKSKKLAKFIDRDQKNVSLSAIEGYTKFLQVEMPTIFSFSTPELNQVAVMLSNGESKREVREKLGLSKESFKSIINQLKEALNDKISIR